MVNNNNVNKPIILNLLAGICLDNNRYNAAMQLYNRIINEYPNSYAAINAMFEKFSAALNFAGDKELAAQILSNIQSLNLNEEEFLARIEMSEHLLANNSDNLEKFVSGEGDPGSEINNVPNEYLLLGNYPNPFNPSTTISYALLYQSSVDLVIYDIMGREIKSFNISSQSSGYQNILWDGTNENGNSIASGIYLYRISIKSLDNNEVFAKTAKLMMLK